jgi:WhiB family redox-sensing transcriptional regulator
MVDVNRAFTEFAHAQAEIEDSGGTLPCREFPELFYPEDHYQIPVKKIAESSAKILCSGCPLLKACKDYAVAAQESYGIWGGTNPQERREIRLEATRLLRERS